MSGWTAYPTPLGEGWIEWNGDAIVRLGLPGGRPPETASAPGPAWVRDLGRALTSYWIGEGPLPGLPDGVAGPETTRFREQVYALVGSIPAGRTMTYAEVAAAVGRPGAARAVGAAMADNRLAPVIPCHRVVGTDGSLRGYAGGVQMKRRLLEMEASYA